MEVIIWLMLFILFIVAEIITVGLVTIWFAGGALIAIILALFQVPVWLQIVIFLAVSLILLFFTRPYALKMFNKGRVKTNIDSMIGQEAIVIEAISNLEGAGRVIVNGQEWSAKSHEGEDILEGAVVEILEIKGVKLVVKQIK